MDDKLTALVGPSSTPIKRLKGRAAREEVRKLLKESGQGPELQLRGYLSAGRAPAPELLDETLIAAALDANDCAAFLPQLSREQIVIDAEEALKAILRLTNRKQPTNPRKLASGVARAATKWTRENKSVEISHSTLISFLEVTRLLCMNMGNIASRARKSRKPSPLTTIVKAGTFWSARSAHAASTIAAVKTLKIAEEKVPQVMENLEHDAEFSRSFEILRQQSLHALSESAERGNASQFRQLASSLLAFAVFKKDATEKLKQLHEERGRFQESVQTELAELAGVPKPDVSLTTEIKTSVSDAVQTTQLASALLSAWMAREEGPKAKELFEELRSILQNFFGLKLRGNVGETGKYNPRLHEFAYGESKGEQVSLVRPWVEIVGGDGTVKVAMKALVKASGEKG